MKTRSDFISNSSSCSFVVNDMKSFIDAFNNLCNDNYSWLYGLNISFEFDNTKRNNIEFKRFLEFYGDRSGEKSLYVSGSIENIFSIDASFYKEMKNVRVYAYNDNGSNDISKLCLLYYAMKSNGVDIDNSGSENDFNLFSKDVPQTIVDAALKTFISDYAKGDPE